MLKGLIKRFKKDAGEYELTKHAPSGAGLPAQEIDSDKSSLSSIQFLETGPNPADPGVPQTQTSRDFPVPLRPSGKGDLLACRFELKYRISESKAQAIREYIRPYLPMDHYAMTHPDGQYPISSLYFDSPGLDLCKETLLGQTNRFKLRIRAYDDEPGSSVFFEIKRRANKVILKSRARIMRPDLRSALEGLSEDTGRSPKDQEALDQFLCYQRMIQGRPVVLVRYLREPFEGDTENRVRITFDRNLCYRSVSGPEVTLNGQGWHRINLPFVILEIKFTDQYPAWLRNLVCAFNLDLSSMSKYVTSIKQSHQNAMSYYLE